MEGQKYFTRLIILITGILFIIQNAYSQSSYKDQIYEAYARGNMNKWYTVMKAFETEIKNKNLEQKIELINYYYGYTGWLVSIEKDKLAEDYIDKSERLMDQILIDNPLDATVMAYKGAFIAYEIGVSSIKAIYLGKRSIKYIEEALEIEPENIQANIEKGNAKYYSPTAFGGDKNEAIIYYKKAIRYIEIEQLTNNNWMYLNIMTVLGLAYEATGQIQNAKLCYEKILRIKPNFMWVGDELYPDMLKRHNL